MAQTLIKLLDDCGLHSLARQSWLAYCVVGLVQVALILALVMTCVAVYTWMERKISGRIQDRLGPSRVGGRFGWLQPVADGLKLLCKEDIVPAEADGFLFRAAPYLSFCAAFVPFLALPFAPGWVVQPMDTAAFFVVAMGGLEVFGVILAGYASGSKWSLYGAMREAAQVVSFEIPLGMCVVVPVLMAGTMNLTDIAQQQAGWFTSWNLINPFALATFLIYMVCATAGTNRAPFDLPEAESELVAGFMTEYSGFRWAMFFMGEYSAMFLLALLGAILFCGGWNGPIPIATLLRLTPEYGWLAGFVGNFLGMCSLVVKGFLGVTFMMWLRWTLPRLRIDQVMTTCLKYCVPLAAIMLVGTMVSIFVFRGGISQLIKRFEAPAQQNQRTETDLLLKSQTGNLKFQISNLRSEICNLKSEIHSQEGAC
ncbi:MAG: NADH-quinone oxidoreductase subunit NuoH [Thermoguttaceae bacterium]